MPRFADRVKDTTTTTGTGALTLAGAPPTGFVSFATGIGSSGAIEVEFVVDDGAGNWEHSLGTFNGTTGLTRDTVIASSTGSLVSFAAGTKTVYVTPSNQHLGRANRGSQYAMARGAAQP
jgi:hypothetical protein